MPSYKNGFVTEFELGKEYLSKFKIEKVGLDHHTELWVPAEEMEEFNNEIINNICAIEAYHENPKKEYVFIEAIIPREKEIEIFFRFISKDHNLNMAQKKSIGDLNLKNFISHVRKTENIESITWLVRILKKDFEVNSFNKDSVQEFEVY